MNKFTIGERLLVPNPVMKVSTKGVLSQVHLEQVRDYLAKLEDKTVPQDYSRTLDQLQVDFTDGVMTGKFLNSNQVMRFTDTGASQTARVILPGHFYKGLKNLAHMDDQGAKLATLVWGKFASKQDADPRKVRTVNMKIGNEIHRVIRSCVSQTYASYSNLEFVNDILNHAGDYANMPIVDWRVTDNGMRIRFCALDDATFGLGNLDPEYLLENPVPMIEAWNSETACRKVGLRGGMWKLVCTNGMGHWNKSAEFKWIHRGSLEQIRTGVASAFENLILSAEGVVDSYNRAIDVKIEDAYHFMTKEFAKNAKLPERLLENSKKALHDPTTTPGETLASVIDAITLAAQSEPDIFRQLEAEQAAASILARGHNIAAHNNNRIPKKAA
jgi:hypothetical protein